MKLSFTTDKEGVLWGRNNWTFVDLPFAVKVTRASTCQIDSSASAAIGNRRIRALYRNRPNPMAVRITHNKYR
jgi:hypothetical protein